MITIFVGTEMAQEFRQTVDLKHLRVQEEYCAGTGKKA